MLPRKRHRSNTAAANSFSLPTTALSPETSSSRASSALDQAGGDQRKPSLAASNGESRIPSQNNSIKEVRKTHSWYGSWPRAPKAFASTSVARENILGDTVKSKGTPDLSRFEARRSDDTTSLHSTTGAGAKSSENSFKGSVANKNMDEDSTTLDEDKKVPSEAEPTTESRPAPEAQPAAQSQPSPESHPVSQPGKDNELLQDESTQASATPHKQVITPGWLDWWPKIPFAETPTTLKPEPGPTPQTPKEEDATGSPEASDESRLRLTSMPGGSSTTAEQTAPPESLSDGSPIPDHPPSMSWFGLWPSTLQANMKPLTKEADSITQPDYAQNIKTDAKLTKEPEDMVMKDTPVPQTPPVLPPPPKAGASWAFWSKVSPKNKEKLAVPESGEIAVIGEGSEAQPTPMAEDNVSESPAKDKDNGGVKDTQPSSKSIWRRSKRLRPLSMDMDAQRPSSAGSSKTIADQSSITKSQQMAGQALPLAKVGSTKNPIHESIKKAIIESETLTKQPPNLLLPSFTSTYRMKENVSILKQITNLVLRASQPPPNHVFRIKDPPKIRKAIAIGVHGLFPAMYLRPMIGQPTGTSLRFANLCADAIRRWVDSHGYPECEVEKVALEGDGRISDRVDNLWKLMLNWVEHIRQADLIVVACHSQGVPVSIMLIQKLIDLGIVTHAKIGVCAMAGVALGPFPDYKSSILMGSAAELWDFGNPRSNNSKRFEACLGRVLDYGARITFIGSIDDQLVPMESAVYSPANHPYIYRAVFIDGRVHAPDFISHLVGFALKLRNLGISDHGLVRELSVALAGSLYSGEGHSRLYYEDAVYDLAVMHALETTNTAQPISCQIPKRETTVLASANPYVLPWIMRGLLEEDFVKTQLSAETEELLRQFDDWKPTNKALKDVKYRLEAVRSKL